MTEHTRLDTSLLLASSLITGLIPVVGEAADLEVLFSPLSRTEDRILATISLAASVMTATLLPNFGGALRAGEEVLASRGATTAGETAVLAADDIPATFIGQANGPSIVVPRGATGPTPALNGAGVRYTGGSGGPGLSPKVSGVRIMEPTAPKGPSPGYPNGYGSYTNAAGQTVNPMTGRTISPSDPWWHIPLGP